MNNLFSFRNKLYLCHVNNYELMNYPLISEYVEAIKAAEDNLDQLKHLSPVLDDDGMPVMSGGNFAVVFKMKDEQTGKLHAVKCFLKEQEGRAEAYRQIAEELEFVSSTFLTPIKYLDKELFVDSANSEDSEFPVLLMDWVEGQTLDKYIREHIDDQYDLSLLAYQFSRLAMWLMPQPFAHGDLKPDNILVKEDGTLVLVDYDGMYVPAMKGQRARELGSPDFRHPGRTEEVFDDHIDDFSLASILLSLKAIALQPSLLEEYGASDRLLFSEKDYRKLSESSALGALQPLMQDAELASLYSLYILALSQNNLSQVSFRLFNLCRPDKSQYEDENLSTKVTEEDLANAWTDEFGVKYSANRKRLLKAPKGIDQYTIIGGTKIICDNAFCGGIWHDMKIKHISIPDSVISIGSQAFSCCDFLTTIVIPSNVVEIGKYAFSQCKGLKCITLSDRLKKLGESVFYYCPSLTSITIPNGVKVIEKLSFSNCWSLSKVILPTGLLNIEDCAFSECGFSSIDIPNTVTHIGVNAFKGCLHLTSFFLPDSISYVGRGMLNKCSNLSSINVGLQNNYYDSRDNCNAIIETSSNTLIAGCSSTIIPAGVIKIGDYAFSGNIPIDCSNFEQTSDKRASWTEYYLSLSIPSSVLELGDHAFEDCHGLGSISLPKSLKIINRNSFLFCDGLTTINIPKGTMFHFEELLPDYKDILVEENEIENLSTEVSEEDLSNAWTDEYGVKYSADKTHLIKAPSDIVKYSIREGTKYINNRAFDFCVKLVSITIPESVICIGDSSFGECHNLSEIKNLGRIETVGHFSFAGCRSLKSIKFNEGLVKMGGSVFKGCVSLHSVYIPSSVDSFGDLFPSNGIWLHANRVTTFDYCDSLKDIIIPVGSRRKFEKLLPNYKDKLVDENRGWRVKETRPFSPDEIAAVARAEVVPSQYGNSVCFFMNGGGQTYIPLLSTSSLTVGESVDLKTAKLVTLCREGKDDIYRVIE